MKFEIDDASTLKLSALSTAFFASHALLAPKDFQSTYLTMNAGSSNTVTRFFGTALAQNSMLAFGVSMSDTASRDAKKKVLTAVGASWAWSAGQSLYNVEKGYQKQDVGYGMVAYKAALAGLCLWRGLKDDD